ncbi:RNA 2',3'-cyclic phosphodiesterase [candidate division WWE3 bacterium]|nr:RNA 2',3'-cyclic phosphodiesterase [candidate division WWE3 bacterium]
MARLFVGIPISEKLQRIIIDWQQQHSFSESVRWIKPENLHITLIPPWETNSVHETIKKVSSWESPTLGFDIKFDTITFGHAHPNPSVIWATGQTPESLLLIRSSLHSIVPNNAEKNQHFLMHTTIGRMNWKFHSEFTLNKQINWKETIHTICLYESKLLPTGAEYSKLKEIQLEN